MPCRVLSTAVPTRPTLGVATRRDEKWIRALMLIVWCRSRELAVRAASESFSTVNAESLLLPDGQAASHGNATTTRIWYSN